MPKKLSYNKDMRDFEKISYEQFAKDVKADKKLYESFRLPSRGSKNAAGYDFALLEDLEIKPGEIVKLPTGVKMRCEANEVLLIVVRSKTGFKYNIRLVNQVGVIDSDYYDNKDNEGHIFIKIQNHGDRAVKFEAGEAVAQGVFVNYLLTDSDLNRGQERSSEY